MLGIYYYPKEAIFIKKFVGIITLFNLRAFWWFLSIWCTFFLVCDTRIFYRIWVILFGSMWLRVCMALCRHCGDFPSSWFPHHRFTRVFCRCIYTLHISIYRLLNRLTHFVWNLRLWLWDQPPNTMCRLGSREDDFIFSKTIS